VVGLTDDPLRPKGSGWFSGNKNQMALVGYDAVGNQTQLNPYTLSYDAENRITGVSSTESGNAEYWYDGEGRRVKKLVNGSKKTLYVYDAFGRLSAEYSTATSTDSGTQYLTADHLGSVRLITSATGAVIRRHDYRPFGEDLGAINGRSAKYSDQKNVQRFTGKERDAETGLDYFESRYFSSAQGRFTSPDVMLGKPEWLVDPQRWNRYAYVRNNPLRYIDPNGEDLVIYYSLGSDVSDEDREWFAENRAAVLAAIQAKFRNAGVKNVSLRDLSTLSKEQRAALDKGSPFGVSRLTLVGSNYPGIKKEAPLGTLGYAHPDGSRNAAVFMDRLPKVPPAGCDYTCIVANVGAHELGHTVGFDAPGHAWGVLGLGGSLESLGERVRELRGGAPDLMEGGRGVPTKPMDFNMGRDRNQRAVEELNRIGDMTPR
jgi:RHS repeat-associated protein